MTNFTVGLAGCGHISSTHLKAWRKTSAGTVMAAYDLDRPAAEKVARRFGIPRIVDSIEELIETVDVVDICTPPQSHKAIVERVLAAKRDVLIEKPLVTSTSEWQEILGLLEQGSSRIAVVHHLKFTDSVRRAQRWITQGRIGRVLRIHSLFLTAPIHDRMLTGTNHWSHPLPGGRWMETLPHNLYLIHAFAGPLAVSSVTAMKTSESPTGLSADEVSVTLEGNGKLATIHFSAHCTLNNRSATIIGSEGAIRLDLLSNLATLHRISDTRLTRGIGRSLLEAGSQLIQSVAQRPATVARRLRGWTPHARLIAAFEQQIAGTGPPPTPRSEIGYVIKRCDEIGQAIQRELAQE